MALSNFKKIIVGGTIVAIMMGSGAIGNYVFVHSNPFQGDKIVSSNFIVSLKSTWSRKVFNDETYYDAKKYIDNAPLEEQKAYLTAYPIAVNKTLTSKEKQNLSLIDFYVDTAIDNEFAYSRHANIDINKNVSFGDSNISESYNRDKNILNIGNENKEFHGLLHATTPKLDVNDKWLEESIVSLAEAEYSGIDDDYKLCVNADRFLCEILGKEKGIYTIVGARYRNDTNAITKALEQKGISRDISEKLYSLLDEYRKLTSEKATEDIKNQRLQISMETANVLATMYDIANNTPDRETVIVKILLEKIMNDEKLDLDKYKFYYWNSKMKAKYKNFCILNSGISEKSSEKTITYIDDYNFITYKINDKGEETLSSVSTITNRVTLDKAESYYENSYGGK